MLLVARGEVTHTRDEDHEEGRVAGERGGDMEVEHALNRPHDLFVRHNHKDKVLGDSEEHERSNRQNWKECRYHSSGEVIPTISDRRQLEAISNQNVPLEDTIFESRIRGDHSLTAISKRLMPATR